MASSGPDQFIGIRPIARGGFAAGIPPVPDSPCGAYFSLLDLRRGGPNGKLCASTSKAACGSVGMTAVCQRVGSFRQSNPLRLDVLPEQIRNVIPHEQVDPERQAAFLECPPQVADKMPLLGCAGDYEIEIGPRMGSLVHAETVRPCSRAWQVSIKQCRDGPAALGVDADGDVYHHCVSLMFS